MLEGSAYNFYTIIGTIYLCENYSITTIAVVDLLTSQILKFTLLKAAFFSKWQPESAKFKHYLISMKIDF